MWWNIDNSDLSILFYKAPQTDIMYGLSHDNYQPLESNFEH